VWVFWWCLFGWLVYVVVVDYVFVCVEDVLVGFGFVVEDEVELVGVFVSGDLCGEVCDCYEGFGVIVCESIDVLVVCFGDY